MPFGPSAWYASSAQPLYCTSTQPGDFYIQSNLPLYMLKVLTGCLGKIMDLWQREINWCTPRKKKKALAVFSFVIICSVIEIVLAAAMMKICETTTKTPQSPSSHGAYYQVLFLQYLASYRSILLYRGRSVIFLSIRCLHCFRDGFSLLCCYFLLSRLMKF